MGDGDVAEEGAGFGVDDCEVCVFALKGGEHCDVDCVGGVEGEGGGRVEVFDGGLGRWLAWIDGIGISGEPFCRMRQYEIS